MFNSIVESVLNEISAEDAYNRFYRDIPKNEFDSIVSEYGGKFDNLIKFIMNAIIKNDCDYLTGVQLVTAYKAAQNNVRIAVINKFKNNEYEYPMEMLNDINLFNKMGVITEKYFHENGLVVLYDDSDIKVTCTTTYGANHHYFGGRTRWCTASDRLGRYDGWKQFKNYVATSTGEIKASLIQIEFKDENKIFQIQYYRDGDFGLCCDEEDNNTSYSSVLEELPDYVFELIQHSPEKLASLTEKSFETESNYQRQIDTKLDFIAQKKEEKRRKKLEELVNEASQLNTNKIELFKKAWDNLLSSNLLSNPEFLNKILESSPYQEIEIENDGQNHEEEYRHIEKMEERARSCYYATCDTFDDVTWLENRCALLHIYPIIGKIKSPGFNTIEDPVMTDLFNLIWCESFGSQRGVFKNVIVIAEMNEQDRVVSIIKVLKPFDLEQGQVRANSFRQINNYQYDTEESRGLWIITYGNETIIGNTSPGFYKEMKINNTVKWIEKIGDNWALLHCKDEYIIIDINEFKEVGRYYKIDSLNNNYSSLLENIQTHEISFKNGKTLFKTNLKLNINGNRGFHGFFAIGNSNSNIAIAMSFSTPNSDFIIKFPGAKIVINNCQIIRKSENYGSFTLRDENGQMLLYNIEKDRLEPYGRTQSYSSNGQLNFF